MPDTPQSPVPAASPAPAAPAAPVAPAAPTNPWNVAPNRRDLLLAGFLGGTISPLMNVIKELSGTGSVTKHIPMQTLLLALIFGGLGALLVRIFQETDTKKAFAFGVTLPSFLIALSAQGPDVDKNPPVTPPGTVSPAQPVLQDGAAFFSFFAPTAIADDTIPAPVNAANRTIEIVTVDGIFPYKAELLGADGQVLSTITSEGTRGILTTTSVPNSANAIRFTGNDTATRTVKFAENKPGSTIGIALTTKKDKTIGIGTILGRGEDIKTTYEPAIEIRDKVPLGKEGWIFLGTREYDRWKFQTLVGPGIPTAGQTYRVVFPVNLREQANASQSRIGILSAGQFATIIEVKPIGNSIWAKAKVASDSGDPAVAPSPTPAGTPQ